MSRFELCEWCDQLRGVPDGSSSDYSNFSDDEIIEWIQSIRHDY